METLEVVELTTEEIIESADKIIADALATLEKYELPSEVVMSSEEKDAVAKLINNVKIRDVILRRVIDLEYAEARRVSSYLYVAGEDDGAIAPNCYTAASAVATLAACIHEQVTGETDDLGIEIAQDLLRIVDEYDVKPDNNLAYLLNRMYNNGVPIQVFFQSVHALSAEKCAAGSN